MLNMYEESSDIIGGSRTQSSRCKLPVCDIYDCEFKIKSMTLECGHNEYLSFQMKIYTSTLSGYTSVNVKRNTIDLYCGSNEAKGGSSCFRKTCVPECICFSISP